MFRHQTRLKDKKGLHDRFESKERRGRGHRSRARRHARNTGTLTPREAIKEEYASLRSRSAQVDSTDAGYATDNPDERPATIRRKYSFSQRTKRNGHHVRRMSLGRARRWSRSGSVSDAQEASSPTSVSANEKSPTKASRESATTAATTVVSPKGANSPARDAPDAAVPASVDTSPPKAPETRRWRRSRGGSIDETLTIPANAQVVRHVSPPPPCNGGVSTADDVASAHVLGANGPPSLDEGAEDAAHTSSGSDSVSSSRTSFRVRDDTDGIVDADSDTPQDGNNSDDKCPPSGSPTRKAKSDEGTLDDLISLTPTSLGCEEAKEEAPMEETERIETSSSPCLAHPALAECLAPPPSIAGALPTMGSPGTLVSTPTKSPRDASGAHDNPCTPSKSDVIMTEAELRSARTALVSSLFALYNDANDVSDDEWDPFMDGMGGEADVLTFLRNDIPVRPEFVRRYYVRAMNTRSMRARKLAGHVDDEEGVDGSDTDGGSGYSSYGSSGYGSSGYGSSGYGSSGYGSSGYTSGDVSAAANGGSGGGGVAPEIPPVDRDGFPTTDDESDDGEDSDVGFTGGVAPPADLAFWSPPAHTPAMGRDSPGPETAAFSPTPEFWEFVDGKLIRRWLGQVRFDDPRVSSPRAKLLSRIFMTRESCRDTFCRVLAETAFDFADGAARSGRGAQSGAVALSCRRAGKCLPPPQISGPEGMPAGAEAAQGRAALPEDAGVLAELLGVCVCATTDQCAAVGPDSLPGQADRLTARVQNLALASTLLCRATSNQRSVQTLSTCLCTLVAARPQIAPSILRRLLRSWPKSSASREVLWLQLVQTVLLACPAPIVCGSPVRPALFGRVIKCLASTHAAVALQGLSMCNNMALLLHYILPFPGTAKGLNTVLVANQGHWNTIVAKQSDGLFDRMLDFA